MRKIGTVKRRNSQKAEQSNCEQSNCGIVKLRNSQTAFLAFHFTRVDCNYSVGIAENLKLVGGDLSGSGVQLVPCVLNKFGQGTLDTLIEDESLRGIL
jgi:hypothetical protein